MNMHAPWSEARESALANAKRAIAFASDKLEALQAETTKLAASLGWLSAAQ